jgi:hypothetical protein
MPDTATAAPGTVRDTRTRDRQRARSLILLFSLTIFISAALLFLVQPIIAKRILPLLGGAPNVWNTCMVFFQAVLLAGYAFAHVTARRMSSRRQSIVQIGMLLVAAIALPITLRATVLRMIPSAGNPVPWVLLVLATSVGLPFFVVSASGPMLQRWFSDSGHESSKDPYFLYAASNLGSMVGLLGYPLIVEPSLGAVQQGRAWSTGYALLALLTAASAYAAHCHAQSVGAVAQAHKDEAREVSSSPANARITLRTRLRWLILAAVPSSLLYGVTTYVSTDIASVPLLWVVPLSIYLLTFTLVFAKRPPLPHGLMVRVLPSAAILWATVVFFQATEPITLLIGLHLLVLFCAAMVCHGELAASRPAARDLTEFYLWLSLGGVIGGLFNAILAPLLFNATLEYPLAVILACMLMPAPKTKRKPLELTLDLLQPIAVGVLTVVVTRAFQSHHIEGRPLILAAAFAPGAVLSLMMARRPVRFGLCLAALLLAGTVTSRLHGFVLMRERNFFGTLRVTTDSARTYHELHHGSTLHGTQSTLPHWRDEPLSYYTRTGPAGTMFGVVDAKKPAPRDVAIVGLGTGTTALYAEPGDRWTFYEINAAVPRIAEDTRFFTMLRDSRAASIRIILGDARLKLREAPQGAYDLLVLDAFSSDAIPVHLLTREAMRLYTSRLRPGGILAFHISNRYLDLHPLIAGLALDAGLVAYARDDLEVSNAELNIGKEKSRWVMLAKQAADLGTIPLTKKWYALRPVPSVLWTDDHSNLLSLIKRR